MLTIQFGIGVKQVTLSQVLLPRNAGFCNTSITPAQMLGVECHRLWTHTSREKEQAIEHWMDAASMSSKEAGTADSEARRAQDSTQRLEAEVKRLSTSLAELALAYRSATFLC